MDRLLGILQSPAPAKDLRLAIKNGEMGELLGPECWSAATKGEKARLNDLSENFDAVRPEMEYRLPLVLQCFDEKRAEGAVRYLQLSPAEGERYLTALKKVEELYFVVRPPEFKRFLYQNGMENYEYWENIAKQQRKVHDFPENRILSRYYMLQEFQQYGMAIFPEDLAVDRADLLSLGIGEGKVDAVLEKLLYTVHHKPRLNTREQLLAEAKRIGRNPFALFFRHIHFIK